METIIIAGGSGFLGQILEQYLQKKGYTIKILTRHPKKSNHIYWDGLTLGSWTSHIDGIKAIINLSGKSVDCRYTDENKKLIYNSRIDSTHLLGLAINLTDNPPKVWLNASTATIYNSSYNKEMSEDEGDIGDDFSMNIAKSWEQTFFSIINPKTRKIALRTSIVLGRKGGALIPLKKITQFGLGGKQGHGNQKVSWIHEQDFARAIYFLLNSNLEGSINVTSPNPTDNKTLMKSLRDTIGIPFGLNQSLGLLKFGAKLLNTETELVLKSRNVIPKRLLKEGFTFKYESIFTAVNSLVSV